MILIKGEPFYGEYKGYVYEDNLGKLEPYQVEKVMRFRAGETPFKIRPVIPQMEIEELKRTMKMSDLIDKILDIREVTGELREKQFRKLKNNGRKDNLCEMYLRETSYKSA